MANVKTLISGTRKLIINVTGNNGPETDEIIIDRSTLVTATGVPPGKIRIDEITWTVSPAFDRLTLEFDDGTDEIIDNFNGEGYIDYRSYGGKSMGTEPGTADEGDVLLTTTGTVTANDTYSLLIHCTLKS